jgi:hypothetical protein
MIHKAVEPDLLEAGIPINFRCRQRGSNWRMAISVVISPGLTVITPPGTILAHDVTGPVRVHVTVPCSSMTGHDCIEQGINGLRGSTAVFIDPVLESLEDIPLDGGVSIGQSE